MTCVRLLIVLALSTFVATPGWAETKTKPKRAGLDAKVPGHRRGIGLGDLMSLLEDAGMRLWILPGTRPSDARVSARRVTLRAALDRFAREAGLTWRRDGRLVMLMAKGAKDPLAGEARKTKGKTLRAWRQALVFGPSRGDAAQALADAGQAGVLVLVTAASGSPGWMPHGPTRYAAERALRRIKGTSSAFLLQLLGDPRAEVRRTSARALEYLRVDSKAEVTALVPLLRDPSRRVRDAAERTLHNRGADARHALDALIAMAMAKGKGVAWGSALKILTELGRLARRAAPVLYPQWQEPHSAARILVAKALAAIAPEAPQTVAILVALFVNDPNELVRRAAGEGLAALPRLPGAYGRAIARATNLPGHAELLARLASQGVEPARSKLLAHFRVHEERWCSLGKSVQKGGGWAVLLEATLLNPRSCAVDGVEVPKGRPLSKETLQVLTVLLRAPEVRVRQMAAEQLWRIGPHALPAVGALGAALRDTDKKVIKIAATALRACGPAGVREYGQALVDPRFDKRPLRYWRGRLIRELQKKGKAALPALPQLIETVVRDEDVVHACGEAFQTIGRPVVSPLTKAILGVKGEAAKLRLIEALGYLGPLALGSAPSLIPLLALGAKDEWRVRRTLVKLGPRALSALVAGLGHTDERVRQGVLNVLRAHGRKARSVAGPVLRVLAASPGSARSAREALFAMGVWPSELPLVQVAWKSRVPAVRAAALAGLWSAGPSAAPLLGAGLRDADAGVRRTALEVMVRYPVRAAPLVPGALALLGDEALGALAVRALASRGAVAVDPLLGPLVAKRAAVRARAARALGLLGFSTQGAVRGLLERLRQDSDRAVRLTAAGALGSLGASGNQVLAVLLREWVAGFSKGFDVRWYAATVAGLGKKRARSFVRALLPHLRGKPPLPERTAKTLEALVERSKANLGYPAALAEIARKNKNPIDLRVLAIRALGDLGWQRAGDAHWLMRDLAERSRDRRIARSARHAMRRLRRPELPSCGGVRGDERFE